MNGAQAAGILLGVIAALGISAVHCGPAMTEDGRRARRAAQATERVLSLIESGDAKGARSYFVENRDLFHEVASSVEQSDPEGAEVLHDITVVVDITISESSPKLSDLVHLAQRMSEMFKTASVVVGR